MGGFGVLNPRGVAARHHKPMTNPRHQPPESWPYQPEPTRVDPLAPPGEFATPPLTGYGMDAENLYPNEPITAPPAMSGPAFPAPPPPPDTPSPHQPYPYPAYRQPSAFRPSALFVMALAAGGVTVLAVLALALFMVTAPDKPQHRFASGADDGVASAPSPPAGSPHAKVPANGDGTFLIGTDLAPGRYETTVPVDSPLCYWERLSDPGGELGDIIANGVADSGKRLAVKIKHTDKAFSSTGCGVWKPMRLRGRLVRCASTG